MTGDKGLVSCSSATFFCSGSFITRVHTNSDFSLPPLSRADRGRKKEQSPGSGPPIFLHLHFHLPHCFKPRPNQIKPNEANSIQFEPSQLRSRAFPNLFTTPPLSPSEIIFPIPWKKTLDLSRNYSPLSLKKTTSQRQIRHRSRRGVSSAERSTSTQQQQ